MDQIPSLDERPTFVPVGDNPARVFGLDAETRARRLAAKVGLDCASAARPGATVILADLDFAWDPTWLKAIVERPGSVLMLGTRAVLAHVPGHRDAAPLAAAMAQGADWTGSDFDRLDAATAELTNHELRKRERPFVLALDRFGVGGVERDNDFLGRICGQVHSAIIGGDGEASAATINEDGEFDFLRSAVVEELVESCLHGAAGEKHVVDEDHPRNWHARWCAAS